MEKRLEKWIDDMENIPDELKNDKNFISVATNEAFYNFRYASDKLKNDKEFILELLKENTDIFDDISEKLKDNKEFILTLFENEIDTFGFFSNISDRLLDDKDIALLVLKESPSHISYISDRLKNDIELATIAVKGSYYNFNYVSDELKNNKDFAIEFLKDNSSIFSYLSEELRGDKELALIAMSSNGLELESASKELQADKEVVLEAYNENKDSLKYASEELMLDSLLFPGGAELTLPKRIRNRIQKIVEENGFTEEFTGDEFLGGVEINEYGISIQHATGRLAFSLFDNENLDKLLDKFIENIKNILIADKDDYPEDDDDAYRTYPSYTYEKNEEDEDNDDEAYDNMEEILERGSYNSKKSYATLLYGEDVISVEDIAWGEFENPVAFETTYIFRSMVILNKEQAEDRKYPKLKYIVLTEEFPELINPK